MWTSALFIGQFVCPLVVLALGGALDGLGAAVSVAAAAGVRLARPTAAVDPALAAH